MWRAGSALVGLLAMIGPAAAGEAVSGRPVGAERSATFMRVYGQTPPPYGFLQFCDSFPAECGPDPHADEKRLHASPQRLAELDEVNRHVNRTILPATDLELYGVTEWWTLPADRGDCEDYALLKRHLLIARGWPVGSLLMTVVRDDKGEGHAVLTARIAQGDFILDNKLDEIRPFDQTRYQFVMRQSYIHPRVWMSLDAKDAMSPPVMAGVRRAK